MIRDFIPAVLLVEEESKRKRKKEKNYRKRRKRSKKKRGENLTDEGISISSLPRKPPAQDHCSRFPPTFLSFLLREVITRDPRMMTSSRKKRKKGKKAKRSKEKRQGQQEQREKWDLLFRLTKWKKEKRKGEGEQSDFLAGSFEGKIFLFYFIETENNDE